MGEPGAAGLTPPSAPRSPWQLLYGWAHRQRRRWYATRAARLPRPVVSVGNLHWGGGGKTPTVVAVAGHLRDRGWRLAVLSRGYRGSGAGVRLVSRGEGPLMGPTVAGDEPVLLAGLLPGVAIVVGPDRHRAGLHALARLDPPPDLFLLDDGFSHLALHRDLDLLVFPAADPFARGRLPPGGRLREPLAASARADAALLTGAGVGPTAGAKLATALRPAGFAGPGFAAPAELGGPRLVHGGVVPPGARVLLVSGIARPRPLVAAVRGLGLEVTGHLAFSDHHRYGTASLARIADAFRRSAAQVVVTTGKDRVKLEGRLDLPLAELPYRVVPEPAFYDWLDRRLAHAAEPSRDADR